MAAGATKTHHKGTKTTSTKKRTKRSTKTATRRTKTTTRGAAHTNSHGRRKRSAGADKNTNYPQEGLFKKDAAAIAKSRASKKVSPKGPSSGMRMLTFYVNRAGKNLSKSRLRVLERAKGLLHGRIQKRKGGARS